MIGQFRGNIATLCGVKAAIVAETIWDQLDEQISDDTWEEHYGHAWCRCSQTMMTVINPFLSEHMVKDAVSELLKILQQENKGLVIVMEDTREDMDRFLDKNPSLKQSFNVRVDIEALDDDSLVAYARQYALEKEYAIDNLGILALHTRISERQTLDHDVTVSEVKDIVDDAIYYAEKRTVGHFVDVLVHKRYDENDMIILREKDFMHD